MTEQELRLLVYTPSSRNNFGAWMYSARMSGAEQAIPVSAAALDDAAQILSDKYDVLLDRVTDRLLDMPAPGTPEWYNIFRDEPRADTYRQRRAQIRAALAHRAQVTITADYIGSIRPQRRPRRHVVDEAQLSIW